MCKFTVLPSFVGVLKIFVPVSHKIQIGTPNILGFSMSSDDAYGNFTFIQWEKKSSCTEQPSTLYLVEEIEAGKARILVILQSGLRM